MNRVDSTGRIWFFTARIIPIIVSNVITVSGRGNLPMGLDIFDILFPPSSILYLGVVLNSSLFERRPFIIDMVRWADRPTPTAAKRPR